MIQLHDRVAAVLARDERLLGVFVGASPAFSMLLNPTARRTMARLVTVEQAARVAGIDAAVLLERLNAALADRAAPVDELVATEPPPARRPPEVAPAGLLDTPPDRLVDLDVRDDLRAGREPLRPILDAVKALPPASVLRVRAIFEPAPLYALLARSGLGHFTERLAADDWRVWFFREDGEVRCTSPVPCSVDVALPAADPAEDVVVLDVRDLEPPEPMVRTLEALATLPPGKTLVQINARVPQFLLPKLQERGFRYEIREQSADLVRLFIRHA